MNPDVLQRFLTNLETLRQVYQQLLEVARVKRQHILRNDIAQLREDIAAEESLSSRGAELNHEREALHKECRALLRVKQGGDTLGDLCRLMPRPWAQRFGTERDSLKKTLESLHEANRVNVALVNNSLELMDGLLSALFKVEPVAAYGRNGLRPESELMRGSLNASA